MPDPTIPYVLRIVAKSGTSAGATVIVEDLTKADSNDPDKNRIIVNLDSNLKANVDIANLRSGYSNDDKLRISADGVRIGTAYHTINTSKQPTAINLSETAADYAGANATL